MGLVRGNVSVNEEQFWNIIQESRKIIQRDERIGNMDRQVMHLKRLLSEMSAPEIVEFAKIMNGLLRRAYTWELWGAAHVIGEGGCSDDSFHDFRAWLISMGRSVYEQALADPDSLAEHAYAPEVEDCFFEEFAYIPSEVLEEKGSRFSETDQPYPGQPSGHDWRKNEAGLRQMFPKLWVRAQ